MTRGQWRTIEVLAVMGMFLLALALLLPAVQGARENARQTQCQQHLRNIALSVHNILTPDDCFPQGTRPNPKLPPEKRLSWYLNHWYVVGDGQIHVDVDWEGPWDAPENLRIKTLNMDGVRGEVGRLPYLDCPSRGFDPSKVPPLAGYVGVAGVGPDPATGPLTASSGVFGYDRTCRISDVADGLAHTLLLIETRDRNGPWTAGGPPTVRGFDPPQTASPLGPRRPFGGLHPGVTAVSMADTSGRLLSDATDPQVLADLMTIGFKPKPAEGPLGF